jgi:hypothetical protein
MSSALNGQERMMNTPSSDPNDIPERLPEALLSRLRAADRRDVRADPEVDAAVLSEARAYFGASTARGAETARRWRTAAEAARARPRRPRRKLGRWAAGFAAAAVVLAALLVVRPLDRFGPYDPDDIDRSGRVDILDAFALARMRADGAPIGEAEIDAIAARAVALEPARTGR